MICHKVSDDMPQQLRKLKVYAGSEHPHEAQQPEPLPMGGSDR